MGAMPFDCGLVGLSVEVQFVTGAPLGTRAVVVGVGRPPIATAAALPGVGATRPRCSLCDVRFLLGTEPTTGAGQATWVDPRQSAAPVRAPSFR